MSYKFNIFIQCKVGLFFIFYIFMNLYYTPSLEVYFPGTCLGKRGCFVTLCLFIRQLILMPFTRKCSVNRHENESILVKFMGRPNFWLVVNTSFHRNTKPLWAEGCCQVIWSSLSLRRGETAADALSVYVDAVGGSPHSFWRRGRSSCSSVGDWERAFPSSVNSFTAKMIKKFDKKDEESGKRERSRCRVMSALWKLRAVQWRLLG